MDRCVYCKCVIEDNRAVSVCDKCGRKVWGERMFNAIIESMSNAREKGDLFQGTVNEDLQKSIKNNNFNSLKIK